MQNNPFDLDDNTAYQKWRADKLENYPSKLSELIVEINDPHNLTTAEHTKIINCCKISNMAIYVSKLTGKDKSIPHDLGKQFGLIELDNNMGADYDSITSLTVVNTGSKQKYIPYTDRPIHWHTDGYYNTKDKQIKSLLLHCVQSAIEGGENALLDHEIVYILLRDENPEYIQAFMQPDAICIPPNIVAGEEIRSLSCGPVFFVDSNGKLHMRYTKRTRSIVWKNDELTKAAVKFLESILDGDSKYIFRATLQAGQGLISNNVLHDRSGFNDSQEQRRLLYRARYYQRIAGT
ncbi:TauD/TfdA family dioxygenase [Candidatus Halobeggiatoa sp. HSG11]|nr:TauD/TfdA family dioxygenase [Candidatus Halobeggiatoa sp. HSG11]